MELNNSTKSNSDRSNGLSIVVFIGASIWDCIWSNGGKRQRTETSTDSADWLQTCHWKNSGLDSECRVESTGSIKWTPSAERKSFGKNKNLVSSFNWT